jgi:hypothetical protein
VRALATEALLPGEGDDVELVPRHVLREDLRAEEGGRYGERHGGAALRPRIGREEGGLIPAAAETGHDGRSGLWGRRQSSWPSRSLCLTQRRGEWAGRGCPGARGSLEPTRLSTVLPPWWRGVGGVGGMKRRAAGRRGDRRFQQAGHTADVESAMVRPLRSAL